MQSKLRHLHSLADGAQAQLRQIGDDLRTARAEKGRLDHRQAKLERARRKLPAPDAHALDELTQRIAHLEERQAVARADHKAKRELADRCAKEADDAR